jgi:transcriptional regulator with XRE-family HTH domain
MRKHWLRALRVRLGLTQAEMAREMGVSRARIWQIENRGGALSNDKLSAVWQRHGARLRGMGFSLDDLFNPPRVDSGSAVA